MAKSPETRDRYKISFSVEIDALGHVIAMLTKMGMQNIDYELITDVKRFDKQKLYERPARAIMFEILKDGKAHAAKEFRDAFVKEGREASSISTPVAYLLKLGLIKKTAHATYQFTPAGMKEASGQPDPASESPKDSENRGKRFEINGRERLLQLMSDGQDHPAKTLGEVYASEGRLPQSVSPNLDVMMKKGFVKRVDKGVYRLTAKGLKSAQPGATETRAKPGGNSGRTATLFALQDGPKTWAQLVQIFQEQGRERSTLKSAIDALRKRKIITLVGDSYQLKESNAASPTTTTMTNGVGTHA